MVRRTGQVWVWVANGTATHATPAAPLALRTRIIRPPSPTLGSPTTVRSSTSKATSSEARSALAQPSATSSWSRRIVGRPGAMIGKAVRIERAGVSRPDAQLEGELVQRSPCGPPCWLVRGADRQLEGLGEPAVDVFADRPDGGDRGPSLGERPGVRARLVVGV